MLTYANTHTLCRPVIVCFKRVDEEHLKLALLTHTPHLQ